MVGLQMLPWGGLLPLDLHLPLPPHWNRSAGATFLGSGVSLVVYVIISTFFLSFTVSLYAFILSCRHITRCCSRSCGVLVLKVH